jgi:hypothetical protein
MMKNLLVTGVAAIALLSVWAGCSSSKSPGGTSNAGGGSSSSHSSSGSTAGTGGQAGTDGGSAISVQCNPVTNMGCTNGTGCDLHTDTAGNIDGFVCYQGPNTVADCASCDPTGATPPFCAPGSSCFPSDTMGDGQCIHYCCSTADCGPNGSCATTDTSNMPLFAPVSTTLGVCIAAAASADAGAGAADAGAASPFACNAPATSPSMGSCITLKP